MNVTAWHPFTLLDVDFIPLSFAPKSNARSQATVRREIRRRSNLPKSMQKRLGFKYH